MRGFLRGRFENQPECLEDIRALSSTPLYMRSSVVLVKRHCTLSRALKTHQLIAPGGFYAAHQAAFD